MACGSISQVEKLSVLNTSVLAKFTKPGRGGVGRGLGVLPPMPRHLDVTEPRVFACSIAPTTVLFNVQLYFPQTFIGFSVSCFPHNADSLNKILLKNNIRAELIWTDLS